jgi:hypothetical protein
MKLIERGNVGWNEPDVARVLGDAARRQSPPINHQQHSVDPSKPRELAPSARLTKAERARVPQIYRELSRHGITPERWELESPARGASVMFDRNKYLYLGGDEWPGSSGKP